MRKLNGTELIIEFNPKFGLENIEKEIEIDACVHKVRNMSGFAFVILRTGRYLIQSVYSPDTCKDSFEGVREGTYLRVKGIVKADERGPLGFEILLTSITILSKPAEDYPLQVAYKKLGCSLDVNLDMRSVALRNTHERAIFKFEEGVANGFKEFCLKNDFTQIYSPKIVSSGAEGGANMFKVDYFDRKALLSQSPQFYKQTAVAFFDRVFEIGAVYRAEPHSTSRHLNEYIGLDFEMGFINDMYDVMNMETAMLRYLMPYLKENYANEINILGAVIPEITEIPSVTFDEAIELMNNNGRKAKNKFDLEPEDEVWLCNYAKKEFNCEFIFVTHFPAAKRPFYAMDDKENPRLALSFDLLFRGLEITTGGQRIHKYEEQVNKMVRMGLNPDDFESFLQIHKYGMPPHGGLGLGLERLTMKLLELSNVRMASMFPRDIKRLQP